MIKLRDCSKSGNQVLLSFNVVLSAPRQPNYHTHHKHAETLLALASIDTTLPLAKLLCTHERYPSRPGFESVLDLSPGVGGRVRGCDSGFS